MWVTIGDTLTSGKSSGAGDPSNREGIGLLFIAFRASGATLKVVIGIIIGVALLRATL